MKRVEVLYFAALRDAVGAASEQVDTDAEDLASLYAQLRERHALPFSQSQLRVATGDAFAHWEDALLDGASVALIPPVNGG